MRLIEFTETCGTPVLINADSVTHVQAEVSEYYAENSGDTLPAALISTTGGCVYVRESLETIRTKLGGV